MDSTKCLTSSCYGHGTVVTFFEKNTQKSRQLHRAAELGVIGGMSASDDPRS